jgi:hypothetical protein
MHAKHDRGRLRLGLLSVILVSFFVGCGGPSTATGPVSSTGAKAGERRKEMADFMKNQKPSSRR